MLGSKNFKTKQKKVVDFIRLLFLYKELKLNISFYNLKPSVD